MAYAIQITILLFSIAAILYVEFCIISKQIKWFLFEQIRTMNVNHLNTSVCIQNDLNAYLFIRSTITCNGMSMCVC